MATGASVVIIGAGIVGCAAAKYLSDLGWTDIIVVEQGPLFAAGGSTSHAPGIVFQTNSSRTMTRFAQETVAQYAALEHEGQSCWFGVGSLEVATTPARWADLHRKLGWARTCGLAGELLTPEQAHEHLPLLNPDVILGALYVPSDGVAKPVWAAEELARAATGATFRSREKVIGIESSNGRVTGVVTDKETIPTERVLVCCGIWGPNIGRMAGVPIPLTPVEHQLAWTTPLAELRGSEDIEVAQPVLRHQDQDLYFRQRRDHYAVGGYGHEPVVVDPWDIRPHGEPDDMPASNPFDPVAFEPAWQESLKLLPALERVGIAEAINGMFSFSPDGFPLLGESDRLRGFWVAEGIWITHAAGAARAVAQLMTTGTSDLDLHECDLHRFEAHATTLPYIRERGAQQYREVYDVLHPLQPMERPRPLRRTPFYTQEQALGACFFEARGWEVPRWYEANAPLLRQFTVADREGWHGMFWSPIAGAEHMATRATAGLFDMSPLPKLEVAGAGAADWLDSLLTAKVPRKPGRVVYGLFLDDAGGIRSDVTITRRIDGRYQIGANGLTDLAWLRHALPEDGSVTVRDITGALACLGLWGPRARDIITRVSEDDWSHTAFPYYTAREMSVGEVPVFALRVSYVGELGWELYVSPEYGAWLWDTIWQAGQEHGLIAAGRAAFDTLRLEKGYRLWGVDMNPEHQPHEAGVGFAVSRNKPAYRGKDALREDAPRRLACLRLADAGSVVMGKEPVRAGEEVVGYVTSAGYGYSVDESLAYAWLPEALAQPGTDVVIEYFDQALPATVVSEPRWDPQGERLRV
jgi:glycine cleavage system aminomethyltransferase T/glycine/D-amino acid oxidase-like deaminating enzyme